MDWASCEQEVVRLYVDRAKTIRETLEYLNEKHGIIVTPKQFKSRFGGLKNLRADEWKAVIRKIRKRQAQGKASDVYFNGRKLDPERVRRETRRYSKDCKDEDPAEDGSSIDLGVDSPNPHRIEIRTPASPTVDPPLQGNLDVSHRLIEDLGAWPGHDVDPHTESTDVELVPMPEFDLDFMDLDFSTPRIPAKSHHPSPQHSSLVVSLPLGATRVSTTNTVLSCRSRPSFPFRSRISSVSNTSTAVGSFLPPRGIYAWQDSPLTFFWDLPDISSSIPVAGAISTLILENELCIVNWGQKHERLPRGAKGWLWSHLVGVDRKLEALQPVADFVEELLRYPSTAHMDTQVLFYNASQQSLFQIFATVAYLASNNILEGSQMWNFLRWVSAMGFLEQLSRFLQMESANVYAFRVSILRATTGGRPRVFFTPTIEFPEVLRLLLSVDRSICSGRLGGELLHWIASSRWRDDAGLLLFHGADINFVQDLYYPGHSLGTPLCRAILFGAGDMAKCLISAGCDINKRFKTVANDGEETALTMAIQKGYFDLVTELLNAGAKVDSDLRIEGYSVVEFAQMKWPRIYELLSEKMEPGEILVFQLIEEARKGNRPLSRFLLEHNILHEEILERALYQSIKLGNRGAVRTLLQRGIDPDARRSRLIDDTIEDTSPVLLALTASSAEVASDLLYLLIKAGAEIDDDILMRICRSAVDKEYFVIFNVLADAGYNAALFGPSGLEDAANDGQIYLAGFYLDVGAPINAYGVRGRNCLQVAARRGHLPLVHYLMDRGADINFPASDDGGRTALQGAAEGGHTEVVHYLIDTGADVRAAPAKNRGVTVLEAAAAMLEDDGKDRHSVWFRDQEGLVSMFKSLLALGAPINRANGTSGTVLHGLLRVSRLDCVKLALQAGAQIEDREPYHGMSTPLQVAAANSEMEAIRLLLECGADINAPAGAEFGRTALQAATSAEKIDPGIIDLLLLYGADVNALPATRGGVTALQGAAIRGDIQIARMLLVHEADVNAPPALEDGRTAVEGAAEHGRLDMIRLLLSVGAKADQILGFVRAIELAENNGHLALADLLRKHEIATRPRDTMAGPPAELWLTQCMVYDEGLEVSI